MTHLLISGKKIAITVFFIATTFFSFKSQADCDLYKTPLTRESRCEEYVKVDKRLNLTFKSLLSNLNKKDRKVLFFVQRAWLEWREKKCDEVQEEIRCGNSICDGVAHDYCIVDLTKIRAKELEDFLGENDKGRGVEFRFSKEYRYE